MPPLRAPSGISVPPSSPRKVADQQPGFAGGLNTVSNDFALRPDQMRRAENVRLTDYGAVTKRGGTQRTTTNVLAAAPIKNGYAWNNAGTVQILALCNGKLFTTTYGAFPLTWTDRLGTFATTTPSFAAFRDGSANMCYIATGGALQKWSGSARTSITNAVHATGVVVHNNRLWGWGVSGTLDSIYYSNLSDAVGSTGGDSLGYGAESGGQIVIRTFGQQDIVSAASVGTSLLIFHRRGISRITGYGQSDIAAKPAAVTADVGCVGKEAVCVYDNVAYFVSERGLYAATEGDVTPIATPEKPDEVLPQLLTLSSANLAAVKCTFNRAKMEVWVQLPGIGVYVYHTILRSWSGPFVGGYISPDTTCLFEALTASNQPVMLRGDASGWVSLCDSASYYKDNVTAAGASGTAYNAVIQCRRMFSGDPTRANSYRWANLLASLNGSTMLALAWNTLTDAGVYNVPGLSSTTTWGGTGTTWGTGTWGAGGQTPYYLPIGGTGPFIDLTITDSGQGPSEFASVQIEGVAIGRR